MREDAVRDDVVGPNGCCCKISMMVAGIAHQHVPLPHMDPFMHAHRTRFSQRPEVEAEVSVRADRILGTPCSAQGLQVMGVHRRLVRAAFIHFRVSVVSASNCS